MSAYMQAFSRSNSSVQSKACLTTLSQDFSIVQLHAWMFCYCTSELLTIIKTSSSSSYMAYMAVWVTQTART